MIRAITLAAALVFCSMGLLAQSPQAPLVDTAAIGPQVGSQIPPFSGIDQFGKSHTRESMMGPKGAMLVFFRSADW